MPNGPRDCDMVLSGDLEMGNKGCEGLFISRVRKYMCAAEPCIIPIRVCEKKQVFPASMRINCEKEVLEILARPFSRFRSVHFSGVEMN